jgi:hypothetical protein
VTAVATVADVSHERIVNALLAAQVAIGERFAPGESEFHLGDAVVALSVSVVSEEEFHQRTSRRTPRHPG